MNNTVQLGCFEFFNSIKTKWGSITFIPLSILLIIHRTTTPTFETALGVGEQL